MAVQSQWARKFFDGTNIATTGYVYNASLSNAATSGWIEAKGEYIFIQTGVSTLNASWIEYRVEGKSDTIDRAASITVASITSAGGLDQVVTITPKFKEYRIGVRAVASAAMVVASPNNFYAGICITETH